MGARSDKCVMGMMCVICVCCLCDVCVTCVLFLFFTYFMLFIERDPRLFELECGDGGDVHCLSSLHIVHRP